MLSLCIIQAAVKMLTNSFPGTFFHKRAFVAYAQTVVCTFYRKRDTEILQNLRADDLKSPTGKLPDQFHKRVSIPCTITPLPRVPQIY